jgi:hypothetical protein
MPICMVGIAGLTRWSFTMNYENALGYLFGAFIGLTLVATTVAFYVVSRGL